ncbi:MAG: recombination protein RecR [Candidatus Omnitrophica bacterium]|nr:recombination protein RecR [Candidatus Omnitrophota bacterium]
MKGFPQSMNALITYFGKMPGIGPKTAQRLAFFILKTSEENARNFADAILKVKAQVRFCSVCNNLSDSKVCHICSNPQRNKDVVCVVERPNDVISIEKMGKYNGVYHVLLGALSPLDGIGPKDLKIVELIKRIKRDTMKEVIIATDSHTEGEATALYITKLLKGTGLKVTRIASGIPVGANLEYADQATLMKAFEGRVSVTS